VNEVPEDAQIRRVLGRCFADDLAEPGAERERVGRRDRFEFTVRIEPPPRHVVEEIAKPRRLRASTRRKNNPHSRGFVLGRGDVALPVSCSHFNWAIDARQKSPFAAGCKEIAQLVHLRNESR